MLLKAMQFCAVMSQPARNTSEKYLREIPQRNTLLWSLVHLCFSLPELVRLQLRECQIETVSGVYNYY